MVYKGLDWTSQESRIRFLFYIIIQLEPNMCGGGSRKYLMTYVSPTA